MVWRPVLRLYLYSPWHFLEKLRCMETSYRFELSEGRAAIWLSHFRCKIVARESPQSICTAKRQNGKIPSHFAWQKASAEKFSAHLHGKKPARENSRSFCHFSGIVSPAPILSAGRMAHIAILSLPNIKIWFYKPVMAYGRCKYTYFS